MKASDYIARKQKPKPSDGPRSAPIRRWKRLRARIRTYVEPKGAPVDDIDLQQRVANRLLRQMVLEDE